VLDGPSVQAQILVTATVEQVAAAMAASPDCDCDDDPDGETPLPPDAAGQGSGPQGPARPARSRVAGAAVGMAHSQHDGPLPATVLSRLLCDSGLQRVLMSPGGAVLDLGRSVRLATPAQRKALMARDGGCAVPGCTAIGAWCDVHHVRSWAAGGSTDLINLVLLCPRHHGAVHAGIWTVRVRDGLPWVAPPPWIDPERRLLRNTSHLAAQTARRIGQRLRLLLDDGDHDDDRDHDPP
jgi:hypothetical protein